MDPLMHPWVEPLEPGSMTAAPLVAGGAVDQARFALDLLGHGYVNDLAHQVSLDLGADNQFAQMQFYERIAFEGHVRRAGMTQQAVAAVGEGRGAADRAAGEAATAAALLLLL